MLAERGGGQVLSDNSPSPTNPNPGKFQRLWWGKLSELPWVGITRLKLPGRCCPGELFDHDAVLACRVSSKYHVISPFPNSFFVS